MAMHLGTNLEILCREIFGTCHDGPKLLKLEDNLCENAKLTGEST